ncbi:hypothetical protein [Arthrobacter sp. NPDC090010]|uniref:hypothetical protein n=1 Tax=Arthrobacter sp. NPDC090010 TaxID=3363942 RepID=UPI003828BD33
MITSRTRPFTTRIEYYQRQRDEAAATSLSPGNITRPDRSTEPGIVILTGNYPRIVLTLEQAWQFAQALADLLDTMPQEGTNP